ncbi:MAG: hypothetical protein ABI318_17220 [Chthoniobacteraceae bacterium]
MPFDPTKPADHSPDSSAEMRGQLNGLKDPVLEPAPARRATFRGLSTLAEIENAVAASSQRRVGEGTGVQWAQVSAFPEKQSKRATERAHSTYGMFAMR